MLKSYCSNLTRINRFLTTFPLTFPIIGVFQIGAYMQGFERPTLPEVSMLIGGVAY